MEGRCRADGHRRAPPAGTATAPLARDPSPGGPGEQGARARTKRRLTADDSRGPDPSAAPDGVMAAFMVDEGMVDEGDRVDDDAMGS